MEVKGKKFNKLLGRREILLRVTHEGKPTPSKAQLKEMLISKLKCDPNLLFIIELRTPRGANESLVKVHVYDSPEFANLLLPGYLRARTERSIKADVERAKEGEKGKQTK